MSACAIARVIDRLNEGVGRVVSCIALFLVFTTFTVAALRYGFSVEEQAPAARTAE